MKAAVNPLVRRMLVGVGAAVVVAAQGLALGGCLLEPTSSSTCLDDTGCGDGAVCAFGLCVDANDARLDTVDLEVEPLASTGLPAQSIFGVDASTADDARVDVALRGAATLRGTAVLDDGGSVSGVVSVTPLQSIAGRLRLPTTTSVDGHWALPLVVGDTYRVSIVPDDDAVAPAVADADITAGVDDDVALASCHLARVEGDATTCAVVVTGRVVAGAGAAALGVPALEVRIGDATGRRVSTLARTDDDGAFTLGVPAPVSGAVLEIRGTADNALQPTIALPIDLSTARVDLGVITQGARAETVTVAGRVLTDGGAPARAATLVIRGAVGAGLYAARATTDDDGAFSLAARPGVYDVAAVGAGDSDDGLFLGALVVDAAVLDAVFTLQPRTDVTLAVQRSDGSDVAGASVVLQRIGDALGVAEPVLVDTQPSFLSATDDDGVARARVSAGRYRVTIEPPRDSGAPVFSALLAVDGPLTRTLVLPDSVVLAGSIRSPGDDATSGAVVRVFSPIADEQGRAIFLGEAVTAADGSFSVAVPQLRP
jgi:hypothetical protein